MSNLLTAAFPIALADALDRTFIHAGEVIALPQKATSLATAQADKHLLPHRRPET